MAANRELTVALRLQSQMQDARRDLEGVAKDLDQVGKAGRAAGEQTRLDKIGQDAADAARQVDAARGNVDKLAQATKAAASAGSADNAFVQGLRQQVQAQREALIQQRLGTEELMRYRAAQAGASAESAPLIQTLTRQRAAFEAAARAAQEEAAAQRQAAMARQAATAQADAFIASLREQVALQGKSQADVLRYRAGTMGIGSQAEKYIAEIERFNASATTGGKALNRFGRTASQTAEAMRQLPSQITDITTSLASGMPLWLVAVQQGGQIKDSFGGWSAAGNALLKVLAPMKLVMFGAAAAVGALAAAWISAERDTAAFNRAVQSTGNYAGATRGQLEALAESAARSGGITRGAARDAATAMVQSGRLGMQTIGNLTRVVADFASITGQSTAAAAKSLSDLFAKPVEGAEKLNEQFHFLTLEQMRYIRQLEEQGRVEEARLELSQRFAQHLGGTFVNNLGNLERAWMGVGNAVKGAWEWLKKWGAADTVEAGIASQQQVVQALRAAVERERSQPGFGGYSRKAQALQAAEEKLAAMEESQRLERRAAGAKAERAQLEGQRIELDKRLQQLAGTLKTNREKIQDEKKLLDDALKLGVIKRPEYDKLLAGVQEKYKERDAARPKADPAVTAFEQRRLELTQQLAVEQQKLANTVFGVGSSQETATAKLEAWIATSSKAEKLDSARVAELRKLAGELDRVAAEQDRAAEAAKRRERIDTGMASVDAQMAQASGRTADAAAMQIEQRFRQLRQDLAAAGETEGLIKLDKLIDMSKARAQLEELRGQVDLIFGEQGRQQQTLQAEMQAGLVGELDGRQRLLDIQLKTAQAVDALLPRMRELAARTGVSAMAAGVADLEARVAGLKLRADELKVSFTGAFQDGLGNALASLANDAKSLGEAVRGFVAGLAQAMAQFAANKLAQEATGALMGGIDQTLKGVQGLIPAFGQAAAAKIAADQAMTASGVAATTESAAAATAAGSAVAAANAPAAAATATWSWGAAAAAGLAALAAIYALAKGFDRGGYTGPGGKYQPAGIVHAGEVVIRREVVREAGMLPLLLDVNKRGRRALPDALPRWPGFADGGLVRQAPAAVPALAPMHEPAKAGGTVMRLKTVNVLDPALFDDYARSSAGEKTILNFIRRNGTAVRSAMGGG